MWTGIHQCLENTSLNGENAVGRSLTEFEYWSRHCVAGGLSAAVSKTISAPLDRIKTHMQVGGGSRPLQQLNGANGRPVQ